MPSKGDEYCRQAEERLSPTTNLFGLMQSFMGGTQKFDEAADLFVSAANAYKMENKWEAAADMFKRASRAHEQAQSPIEATSDLLNAGHCLKKVAPASAVPLFVQVIDRYNDAGKFSQSAKLYEEVAQIYDEDGQASQATEFYFKAIDLYDKDNKKTFSRPLYLKVASLLIKDGQLKRAADIFETVASESLSNRLGAFGAKDHFFGALMCLMAVGDTVATISRLEKFKSMDHNFPGSRECQFIEKLVKSLDDNNSEDFAQACFDFDRITPLDAQKTELLLLAKKHILDDNDIDIS